MTGPDDEPLEPTTVDEPEAATPPSGPPMLRARVTIAGREPDVVEFEECPVQVRHDRAVRAYLAKHGLKITPFAPKVEYL